MIGDSLSSDLPGAKNASLDSVWFMPSGNAEEAIRDYRKVLTLTPSNTDVMEELAAVYEATGDMANAAKYRTKIEVVRRNIAAESNSALDS